MLTRRGRALLGVAFGLLLGGRLLGVIEFYVMGAAAAALVVVSATAVALARLRLEVSRQIHPPRVHAGSSSRVEIRVRNRARRRTPVLRLDDAVTGTRGARLILGPLRPGEAVSTSYALPTDRRGLIEVGPLEVVLSDPFGITESRMRGAGVAELTVFPRITQVAPPPHTTGDDPHAGAEHPNALGGAGDDFYALRNYVLGDDLRRVHWKTTARRDDLMVRQDEQPWQGRATVLVDIRRATTTPESLELVISAAASIVHACWRRQDLVRLVSTDGTDLGFAAGHAQMDSIMEHLATAEAVVEGAFRATVDRLSRSAIGGALVAIVSDLSPDELAAIARLRSRFAWIAVVKFEPSSWDPRAPDTDGDDRGLVRVTRTRPFGPAWDEFATRLHTRDASRLVGIR